jgi:M6 family metalloprotease-like protein
MTVPVSSHTVQAESAAKLTNLVLFISFSDTDPNYWNDMDTSSGKNKIGNTINLTYNETGDYMALCVKDYFDIASCGKLQLNNVMPQMSEDDYTIVPITLDIPSSSYQSGNQDYSLISNTLSKLNDKSTDSVNILKNITENLDCYGNDGYIDNVTFLVASEVVDNKQSTLYPHKGELGGGLSETICGVPLNSYNVINYGRLKDGRAGVASHELLHVLGPLDTYINSDNNPDNRGIGAVGCWDIMASTSFRVQYPLAETRKDLGWINIDEATTSGTYTLTSPQSDSNHYALILKTAYSDTEYFVVEYRKQGNAYGTSLIDRMDVAIGDPGSDRSGIIIYRVNLAASPKTNLTQDYIYVFRVSRIRTYFIWKQ